MIEIISWSLTRVNGKPNEPQHRKFNKVEKPSGRVNINGDRSCGHSRRPFCESCDGHIIASPSTVNRIYEFKPGDTVKYFMGDMYSLHGVKRNYVGLYKFIGFAHWNDTNNIMPTYQSPVAVYSALFTDKDINIHAGDVFYTPKHKFLSGVDLNTYPTCPQRYIFEKVDMQ